MGAKKNLVFLGIHIAHQSVTSLHQRQDSEFACEDRVNKLEKFNEPEIFIR